MHKAMHPGAVLASASASTSTSIPSQHHGIVEQKADAQDTVFHTPASASLGFSPFSGTVLSSKTHIFGKRTGLSEEIWSSFHTR